MNIMQFLQFFQQAQNPQQVLMQLMQRNPKYKQVLSQVQNSTNGANYKDIVLNVARQQGISENQVMGMFNMLNTRR